MRHLHYFSEICQVMSYWYDQLRKEPYWDEQLFIWPLVWSALYHTTGPHKGRNCHETNLGALAAFFPEAVPRYTQLVKEANDFDRCIAELAGFEFDCILDTAWRINDLLETLRRRRSKHWDLKDLRKAAMCSTRLMVFLREQDLTNVDINVVINTIRKEVDNELG